MVDDTCTPPRQINNEDKQDSFPKSGTFLTSLIVFMACDIFNCVSFFSCFRSDFVLLILERHCKGYKPISDYPSLCRSGYSISIGVTITSVILYMLICSCFLWFQYNQCQVFFDAKRMVVFAVRMLKIHQLRGPSLERFRLFYFFSQTQRSGFQGFV